MSQIAVSIKSRPLTSAQIRAGRGLRRWSATDLARAAALGLATIKRAESTENETSMTAANDLAIRRALSWPASSSGGGPGVPRNLKKNSPTPNPATPGKRRRAVGHVKCAGDASDCSAKLPDGNSREVKQALRSTPSANATSVLSSPQRHLLFNH